MFRNIIIILSLIILLIISMVSCINIKKNKFLLSSQFNIIALIIFITSFFNKELQNSIIILSYTLVILAGIVNGIESKNFHLSHHLIRISVLILMIYCIYKY